MKKLILGSAMILFTVGAFAQDMSGSSSRIGFKAGVNLSRLDYSGPNTTTINNNTKDNVGFNVSLFGDFGVGQNFFIQPGVSLQNKGTKIEGNFGTLGTGTRTLNVMAVEIPVNAVLRIPTGGDGALQINAGPYVGFNIDGKEKTKITTGGTVGESSRNLSFGNSTNDDMASIDFGANFGLGYRLSNGFLIGANYGLGLSNLVPKDSRQNDYKAVNRVLGFSLGYSF